VEQVAPADDAGDQISLTEAAVLEAERDHAYAVKAVEDEEAEDVSAAVADRLIVALGAGTLASLRTRKRRVANTVTGIIEDGDDVGVMQAAIVVAAHSELGFTLTLDKQCLTFHPKASNLEEDTYSQAQIFKSVFPTIRVDIKIGDDVFEVEVNAG
jgi:hypothetical protein